MPRSTSKLLRFPSDTHLSLSLSTRFYTVNKGLIHVQGLDKRQPPPCRALIVHLDFTKQVPGEAYTLDRGGEKEAPEDISDQLFTRVRKFEFLGEYPLAEARFVHRFASPAKS